MIGLLADQLALALQFLWEDCIFLLVNIRRLLFNFLQTRIKGNVEDKSSQALWYTVHNLCTLSHARQRLFQRGLQALKDLDCRVSNVDFVSNATWHKVSNTV